MSGRLIRRFPCLFLLSASLVALWPAAIGATGDAAEPALQLAALLRAVVDNVTQPHVLQDVLTGRSTGAQARTAEVSAALLRQQAVLWAEGIVSAGPALLRLRDAAAQAQTQRWQAAAAEAAAVMPLHDAATPGQAMRDLGVDADMMRETGVLREASLDADVKALEPAATPPVGSVWSPLVSKGLVNIAGSVVTLPQYCLRVGVPSFGSAYSDASHRGDVAEGVLGGLAPRDAEGQYPCVTRRGNFEQQSLDSAMQIHCMTRLSARVLACGSSAELVDTAQFFNTSATLDSAMRTVLLRPPSAGLLWQRISHAYMGAERSFPAMVWTEGSTEPYERYDPRLQSWFWAAASAPRALVVVLDTGAAMEEFDRREIALRVVRAVIRSIGPADLIALIAARASEPRVFGCGNSVGQCALPSATADGLRLCAARNETLDWLMAGAAESFLDSSYGICDLEQGLSLALQLIEAETEAWAKLTAGTGAASAPLLPRLEVLVVASAHGWAPHDSVRKRAEDLEVALHFVSIGALGTDYEKTWLKKLACGDSGRGTLSHIPYRYIWQQTAGAWYRLAARKWVDGQRLVAVSALRLSANHGLPVVTLSAAFYGYSSTGHASSQENDSQGVRGVVAMDVAPGPVLAQVMTNFNEFFEQQMVGPTWWSSFSGQQEEMLQMWVVDSSGIVLAHPALPIHSNGFTYLQDLEGAEVFSQLFGWWDDQRSKSDTPAEDCAGPVLFNTTRIDNRLGPWRVGRPVQRAAFMMKVGGLVQHLDALLIIVFGGGDSAKFSVGPGSDMCASAFQQQGLELLKTQPGFPLTPRVSFSLLHHYVMKINVAGVSSVPGAQLGEALYGTLGNVTIAHSLYTVSARGMLAPQTNPTSFSSSSEAETRTALDALTQWLLVVNLTSTGRLLPAAPVMPGGGYREKSVRDILATSQLDLPWTRSWMRRQQLLNQGMISSLFAAWRFLSVTTESGTFRVFPGYLLGDGLEWTSTESYVRTLEATDIASAAVAGPYPHPTDGVQTVSLGSVVWEQDHLSPAGVVSVEFAYTAFVGATLDSLEGCSFIPNQQWCMLLDQDVGVVAISASKLTAVDVSKGVFLGQVEPMLLRALEAAGLLLVVQGTQSGDSTRKGKVFESVRLRIDAATGAVVESESWDGGQSLHNVTFSLQPVAGFNLILVVADGTKSTLVAASSTNILPVTRAHFTTSLAAPMKRNEPRSYCGVTRTSACSSCYLSVPLPDAADSKVAVAGDSVVGSDASQWVREVGGGCTMQSQTLVRAHDGASVEESTCIWWRRRAGWC